MSGEVTIKAKENGPYLVMKDGKVVFALCRCGQSNNKPYCDGSHKGAGFQAPEVDLKVE